MQQRIRVRVADEELWKKFYPATEMIVTKKGRSLFPKLDYKVEGLSPECYYAFQLRMERVDNIKYKFDLGEWHEATKGEPRTIDQAIRHSDGFRRGDEWMKSNIQFSRLKITNNIAANIPNHIILQSMHKYVPVLTIIKMGGMPDMYGMGMNGQEAMIEEEFRFDFTEFIAVTAYQNQDITRLKVQHNKYARGFRSENSRKRDRTATPPIEEQHHKPSSSSASPEDLYHQQQQQQNPAKRMANWGHPAAAAAAAAAYYPQQFFNFAPEMQPQFYYPTPEQIAYSNYHYQAAAVYNPMEQAAAYNPAAYWPMAAQPTASVAPTLEHSPNSSAYSSNCPSTSPQTNSSI
ncbi:unnamed protein product [Caenorhabditis angaria]|uniref:T-box domain-containing protein n=1 Tax=Caenorhabditis angaria TaxID=860376 RepID=A0A9P1IL65_9PELO|nr:unnamed protein product [Caenorhabditis angaria]